MIGARIGRQFSCRDGRFDGAGGPSLDCDAAEVGADVLLTDGFAATGGVDLRRTRIGGQLSCAGGRFDGAGGWALICYAAEVGTDVFLFPGAEDGACQLTGTADFRRMRVAGDFVLRDSRLDGVLILESARIGEGLKITGLTGTQPSISLTEAQAGVLRDDAAAWQGARAVRLAGFRYDRLESPLRVAERLTWLDKKTERDLPDDAGEEFDPHPYTQLAKVYEAAGNRAAAARIRMEREARSIRAARRRVRALDGSVDLGVRSVFVDIRHYLGLDWLFWAVFGYGHAPARAFLAVFLIWFCAFVFYAEVYRTGQMAPASDVVLSSDDWIKAVDTGCPPVTADDHTARVAAGYEMPLTLWAGDPARGLPPKPSAIDYETFSPGLYALDLFVPLDALGQETAWAPSKDRGALGTVGYWARMPIQMAGWIITAVAAAVLTGVIGRKE